MRIMNVRAWSAAVAALLLGATAAGCSSGGDAGSGAGGSITMPIVHGLETTNLLVYDFPAIDSAGLYIADNEGFFAEEGLHVTVIPDFKSSQDTVNLIESGKAQISSGDYVTYMGDLVGQDSNLEIIAEGSELQPNVLALMSGPNSKIRSLKQLEGKAIPVSGINDIGSLLIDSVLTDNDVPISSVHYVPNIPLPAVPSLVDKGAFAAGPVPEPFVTEGEQQTGDTVLADLDQGATTNYPIQGYAVTRQWAQQNPNTLKAFATALEEGQEVANTNRVILQKALEGQPLKVPVSVASVISTPDYPTGIDPSRLQRVIDDMIEFGFFKGKQLAAAKAFQVKNVAYAANLANADGESGLLAG
jgi:NitT/TauT family transport system substrate-binding protein